MIASSVVPTPFSSLTSRIVPTAGPSAVASCSPRNRCARPIRGSNRAGMPSPNFALTGMTARVVVEAGDLEGSSLDEVPAHLEDRRERDLRRADVLGDPAGLAARDAGTPDPVEEGRLAMVHVSQDGHDGLANGSHRHRTKNPSILEGCGPGSSAEPLCRRNMPSWRGTGYRHG